MSILLGEKDQSPSPPPVLSWEKSDVERIFGFAPGVTHQ